LTRDQAIEALKVSLKWDVYSVCVRPCDIPLAKSFCEGSSTAVGVVLGFPHGTHSSASKIAEADLYLKQGVAEIDMVANYGWVRSERWPEVAKEISSVTSRVHAGGVGLKVIFETAQLNHAQIEQLVNICADAGADFVKTSTGFNGPGAKAEDVQLMLAVAAGRIQVKPSGGIRDFATARTFIEIGAHRLGINWTSCEAICSGDAAHPSTGY
jgi:deoxyribose-phosphate aldolase